MGMTLHEDNIQLSCLWFHSLGTRKKQSLYTSKCSRIILSQPLMVVYIAMGSLVDWLYHSPSLYRRLSL